MKLSITAVTSNRHFSKSLIRHSQALAPLRRSLAGAGRARGGIETLQIVFMDRETDAAKLIGAPGQITQVEVGIPEDLESFSSDEGRFVEFVRASLLRAVAALPLSEADREILRSAVSEA